MVRALKLSVCALVAAVAVVGCQTYDFEPVTPLTLAQTTQTKRVQAKRLKPNLMLLVDKSGSMKTQIDSACSGASCATRISELRNAMSMFLSSSGTTARMGLVFFPSDNVCGPADSTVVKVPMPAPTANDEGTDATLTAVASMISAQIVSVQPNGGTPTNASLAFVGSLPDLNDANDYRDDYILLLTDGLPNCNPANPSNLCQDQSASRQALCNCQTTNCLTASFCSLGCLDEDGSVGQVLALNKKNIKTIVVGFGADTSGGVAGGVLTALANAGGFQRKCDNGTDAECGTGDTCNKVNKLCNRPFYQAANGTELAKALADISGSLAQDVCLFPLDARPTDQRYVSVLWQGKDLQPGADSWSYSGGAVTFLGSYCAQIKASTNASPIDVEFRIVEQF